MTVYDPTLAQRVALRILADLGGQATTQELQSHEDHTTMTHYHRLKETEYVDARTDLEVSQNPRALTWTLTDAGAEVVREEASAWTQARETVAAEEVEP